MRLKVCNAVAAHLSALSPHFAHHHSSKHTHTHEHTHRMHTQCTFALPVHYLPLVRFFPGTAAAARFLQVLLHACASEK